MVKVSVIVPVYNVEKYLYKCIETISKQTLTDIEIIILNDGSPDNSEDIILKFCEIDKRIRYYRHKNIGLGETRNRGMELAKGEYLAFVDSDDYLELDMLESLYHKALSDKADVVCGEVFMENAGNCNVRNKLSRLSTIDLKEKFNEKFIRDYYFGRIYSHNSVDKIYRRSFIRENNILFGDNRKIFAEDNYFQFQILIALPRISFVHKALYYYVVREDSIMNSYKKNLIGRHMEMIKDFNAFNHSNDILIKKTINLITFDGLIAETINIVDSGMNLSDLRKSFNGFYTSEIYGGFLSSMNSNRSYILEPNKTRRTVMNVSAKLFKFKFNSIVESILYVKYKYFR